ncbi:TetR/AcrR family transcriptional regulator C-terminal domain-containing protein [Mesorhizobium sp. B2-3-4]|uniref:TetR/AcrR family transcriptional regulator n=1 Tax=Mesorhizobium sp. B2-3-4 TaxID=2589959 RepID=UPI00112C6AD8|nr:TetR/AcrR family transcriptional regulator C-terminal domain-containing protein [Mesorhizobium sp. B2-3-4]TPM25367.1 TetR family transcriptional regulator [Mesorhizobium sp. B2-3-4]
MAAKRSGALGKRSGRRKMASPSAPEQHGEPSLSLERIVATAVDLLDAHGVDGLTMRRLADCLGSGVMSLYWHVDNKEEVFDLALDSALEYRGPPRTAETPDWRPEVALMLEDWRAGMLRHPWSAALLSSRALGPNILGRLELLGATLSRAGVADADLNVAIWSLWNYVMGATITRTSFDVAGNDRSATRQRPAHPGGAYPTIQRSRLLLDDDWIGTFRKGLDLLLAGIAPRS